MQQERRVRILRCFVKVQGTLEVIMNNKSLFWTATWVPASKAKPSTAQSLKMRGSALHLMVENSEACQPLVANTTAGVLWPAEPTTHASRDKNKGWRDYRCFGHPVLG